MPHVGSVSTGATLNSRPGRRGRSAPWPDADRPDLGKTSTKPRRASSASSASSRNNSVLMPRNGSWWATLAERASGTGDGIDDERRQRLDERASGTGDGIDRERQQRFAERERRALGRNRRRAPATIGAATRAGTAQTVPIRPRESARGQSAQFRVRARFHLTGFLALRSDGARSGKGIAPTTRRCARRCDRSARGLQSRLGV
jgi:hypothetical protein